MSNAPACRGVLFGDRKIEPEASNSFGPCRCARGLGGLEMIDTQHQADRRARVGSDVDHENAGHGSLPVLFGETCTEARNLRAAGHAILVNE
jgi:hypothetical protein